METWSTMTFDYPFTLVLCYLQYYCATQEGNINRYPEYKTTLDWCESRLFLNKPLFITIRSVYAISNYIFFSDWNFAPLPAWILLEVIVIKITWPCWKLNIPVSADEKYVQQNFLDEKFVKEVEMEKLLLQISKLTGVRLIGLAEIHWLTECWHANETNRKLFYLFPFAQ